MSSVCSFHSQVSDFGGVVCEIEYFGVLECTVQPAPSKVSSALFYVFCVYSDYLSV